LTSAEAPETSTQLLSAILEFQVTIKVSLTPYRITDTLRPRLIRIMEQTRIDSRALA
jgi:hypothetical protein